MSYNGELRMWRAVLRRAIEDLFTGSHQERREAFCWIFENNPDFKRVCDYAGINPMYVRKNVFGRIING